MRNVSELNMMGKNYFQEYLDANHSYFILVPQNQGALDDLYDGHFFDEEKGIVRDDFLYMVFDEKDYLLMEEYLFNFVDARCDLIITMYEEEWAEGECLDTIRDITIRMIGNCDNKRFIELANEFKNLILRARELKMPVVFYF